MSTALQMPNDLDPYWMPFTANRHFKANPKLFVEAEGMYYKTQDNRQVLDATAGLWCCNAGHRRRRIVEAVQKQVETLDYAPSFQLGHPLAFEFAAKLTAMIDGYDQVFFTNSGSVRRYRAEDRARLSARHWPGHADPLHCRERGYHGVGFGGISVGGIVNNRKTFGPMLSGTDHLPHTHSLEHNAFTRGQPEWGAHLADDLERWWRHDASTIAAVIVNLWPGRPAFWCRQQGYLKRLREICDRHGILLIFDEVITGFGRLGASFATEYFGVKPDLFTTAKGITNGVIPMGAVFARKGIYDAFMDAPDGSIELFHGYTYSGHPLPPPPAWRLWRSTGR